MDSEARSHRCDTCGMPVGWYMSRDFPGVARADSHPGQTPGTTEPGTGYCIGTGSATR